MRLDGPLGRRRNDGPGGRRASWHAGSDRGRLQLATVMNRIRTSGPCVSERPIASSGVCRRRASGPPFRERPSFTLLLRSVVSRTTPGCRLNELMVMTFRFIRRFLHGHVDNPQFLYAQEAIGVLPGRGPGICGQTAEYPAFPLSTHGFSIVAHKSSTCCAQREAILSSGRRQRGSPPSGTGRPVGLPVSRSMITCGLRVLVEGDTLVPSPGPLPGEDRRPVLPGSRNTPVSPQKLV